MWIKKDPTESSKEKNPNFLFNFFVKLLQILELATGPTFTPRSQTYICTKCENTSTNDFVGKKNSLKCTICGGEVFNIQDLKWIDP